MSCMSFRRHSHATGPASGPSVLVANAAALTRPACPAAGDVASFRAGWLFPELKGTPGLTSELSSGHRDRLGNPGVCGACSCSPPLILPCPSARLDRPVPEGGFTSRDGMDGKLDGIIKLLPERVL